jgi:hypothetical protein
MASSTHPPTEMNMRGGHAGGRPHAARHGSGGLATFGGVLLILLAFFNALDGIAAINHSRVFTSSATYVVGDLRAWGWTIVALAFLQFAAGISVLRGGTWGRWFGVVVLSANALAQMFFIPAYPFWSLAIIAIDIVAIYGLAAPSTERTAY